MKALRVYIVDDDAAVRQALSLLLSTCGMTVETFADPETFLAHVDTARPGCLLIDLRMPLVSGLQLKAALAARGIDWPTIMMTGHGDVNACRRAFKAGILDFLTKPVDEQVLLDALAAAGKVLEEVLERQETHALLATLTEREREVMDMVCRGWASKEIAAALAVSPRTIDAHRANIAEKLGTSSVADLVRMSLAAPVATPPSR
ncbi:response regulator transcription factor [Xanthobacter autotrophicus]|uniref:response regulator transcription factor n=1 Tax=Xanthobacter autotrophicus TaxID=280 RepID=UPI0024A758F7|nr:response regulator [Xanthobacter autotrophicus]MDI4658198.1 response regulator [Xanthobacter autotrophicus]